MFQFINEVKYRQIPGGVKQLIFSYLNLNDSILLNRVSHKERLLLKDSAIARENKELRLCITDFDSLFYPSDALKELETIFPLVDLLEIYSEPPKIRKKCTDQ